MDDATIEDKKLVDGRIERITVTLRKRADLQAQAVVDRCKSLEHGVYKAQEPFDQDEADQWVKDQKEVFMDRVEPQLIKVLTAAGAAVNASAGLEKTKECVDALETSQAFDWNKKPREFADTDALIRYLNFKGGYPATEFIDREWDQYVKEWEKPAVTMTPMQVYASWKGKAQSWPTLAPHAMRSFNRPLSAAACERVFSFLEHMNSSDRMRMESKTLANILFLRGNWEVLSDLVTETNADRLTDNVKKNKRQRDK